MLAAMTRDRLPRVLVLAVALVACAWFAIGIRQTRDLNDATALIDHSRSLAPAPAHRGASLLHAAAQLNPDRMVDLERAQLALHEGDAPRARAIARAVTRAEPSNIDAWLAYGAASAGDRPAFTFAYRRLERLAPPVH
jgi:hypothetical protein